MTPDDCWLDAICCGGRRALHSREDLGEDRLDPLLVMREQLGVQLFGLSVGLADEHLTTDADVVGRAVAAGVRARGAVPRRMRPSRSLEGW